MSASVVLKAARVVRAMVLLRRKGVAHGRLPYVRGRAPRISNAGTIAVGRRFKVEGLVHRVDIATGPGGRLMLGDDVFLNRGVTLFASTSITVGDDTRIADLAAVFDTDFHEVEEGRPVRRAPVVIGRNVWIGRGATVLPGVTIGDHAVVAAGAVVAHDVAPRTLVAGVPARPVRQLTASDGWRRR